jgi:hypothetical protein
MRVIAFNCALISGGGRVMLDIAEVAGSCGYEYYAFSPGAHKPEPQQIISNSRQHLSIG